MKHTFLQTHAWLEFQKAVGRKAWRFDDDKIESNIIRHDLPFGKNYLYVPHGPTIFFNEIEGGIKPEVRRYFDYLRTLAHEQHSIYVKLEPLSDTVVEQSFGFGLRHSKKDIQPHKTVILDLTPDEDHLLAQMHHKTRYNINLAQKKGLTVVESDDINIFWELLKKTSEHDKFFTHEFPYYRKLHEFFKQGHEIKVRLVYVMMGDKPIAGEITMEYQKTVYYLHGAMDREYRMLMAPYLMHWEVIKRAKTDGFLEYDFWGIDAQRWPGVTRFKLGFGGRTVEYPGSFDLPISKFWYFIYNLARKIRNV